MVLPDADLRAAEEDVLTRARCGVFFLDLDLADVAGVVDDFGNIRFVSSTHLTRDTLGKVCKSAIHPVLPEDADAVAEGRKVRLNHAKGAVNGPENEENDEHVVRVPEAFKVCATRLLGCSDSDGHQCEKHHVAAPSGPCSKIGEDETHKSELVKCGESSQVVPVSNRVNPREEYNGPGNKLMECNVLIEWDDVV